MFIDIGIVVSSLYTNKIYIIYEFFLILLKKTIHFIK